MSTPRHPLSRANIFFRILPVTLRGNNFLQRELLEKIGIVGAGVAKEF